VGAMDKGNASLSVIYIKDLQTGTYATEDIYNYDASRLLIKGGTFLDNDKLVKLRNFNKGNEIVYTRHKQADKPIDTRRQILEEKTGYAAVKQEAVELLEEIAEKKVMESDNLLSISDDLTKRLDFANAATILSLINALAPVDEYLQRHCVNTGLLNGLMGKWLGLNKETIDRLVLIGLLHDCGKALLPPGILNAPRKLTVTEYQIIKTHTIRSYELLTDFPNVVRYAARGHHEKINGTGYPDRLLDMRIPIEARITAISDIYDAMVSQRAYKKPRSPFNVLSFLKELAGEELDAGLVDLFIRFMPLELIGKKVMLSDGSIGVVRSFDIHDIEFPTVEIDGRTIKTDAYLFCVSMF